MCMSMSPALAVPRVVSPAVDAHTLGHITRNPHHHVPRLCGVSGVVSRNQGLCLQETSTGGDAAILRPFLCVRILKVCSGLGGDGGDDIDITMIMNIINVYSKRIIIFYTSVSFM